VATSTLATPCTTTSTKVATPNALGYLDICTKGYHLAWASHQHPLQFKLLRRDTIHDVPVVNEGVCQLTGILRFLSSLTVRDVLWSRHYRYDCMGMLEYTSRLGKIRYRYDFFLVLYSKSVSCTPIYTRMRLSNAMHYDNSPSLSFYTSPIAALVVRLASTESTWICVFEESSRIRWFLFLLICLQIGPSIYGSHL
jgi:hypothetical protein